ncbi:MAG: YigZ family protein [Bacteroidales bacterium]|nr:YigZ family protein [Bacteroidales bacterium]
MESFEKPVSDCYKSISSPASGVYKDKGSKFLSFAFPVESEDRIKELIAEKKSEYFDARHHCYAYRLGLEGKIWRMNDDGEPSSTAGKPILGQILSNELSDILIIVVRYFGGTLLGTSGLIQAYKSAAADAIANAEIVDKIATKEVKIVFSYILMNDIMKILKNYRIIPKSQQFDNTCTIVSDVRLSDLDGFIKAIGSKAEITTE